MDINYSVTEFLLAASFLIGTLWFFWKYSPKLPGQDSYPYPNRPVQPGDMNMSPLTEFISHHTDQDWKMRNNLHFAVPRNAFTRFRIIVEEQGFEAYLSSIARDEYFSQKGQCASEMDATELAEGLWDTLFTFMSPREISAVMNRLEEEMKQYKAKKRPASDVVDVTAVERTGHVQHVVV